MPGSAPLHLVCYGSGSPMSLAATEALRLHGGLSMIVVPRSARNNNPLAAYARRYEIPVVATSDQAAVERLIRGRGIALLCCASFPEKIPAAILSACSHGGINLHPSLLPRHRGVDPIFWTYVADDRETGVTIHRMTDRMDEGEILDQTPIAIERGRSCLDLYLELSRIGAARMLEVVRRIAENSIAGRPQNADGGGADPAPASANFAIPFDAWPAERVWHVLSGLGERYHDLLRATDGRIIRHGRATSFERATHVSPGNIEIRAQEIWLHCQDGLVRVRAWRKATLLRRVVHRVTRWFAQLDFFRGLKRGSGSATVGKTS